MSAICGIMSAQGLPDFPRAKNAAAARSFGKMTTMCAQPWYSPPDIWARIFPTAVFSQIPENPAGFPFKSLAAVEIRRFSMLSASAIGGFVDVSQESQAAMPSMGSAYGWEPKVGRSKFL